MDIVARAAFMFSILYVLLRIMGKRELGQMTPFELVVMVVLGDLIQQGNRDTRSAPVWVAYDAAVGPHVAAPSDRIERRHADGTPS